MAQKKLKQAGVDDSTIKIVKWEIVHRRKAVPVDPEEPDGGRR